MFVFPSRKTIEPRLIKFSESGQKRRERAKLMLFHKSDREWEKFGRNDPYYGVLSHEKFRRDTLNNTTISDFFDSGQEHIAFVLKTIRACIYAEFSPARALD